MYYTELLHCKPSMPKSTTEIGAGAPEPARCAVGGLIHGLNNGWCLVRPIPKCPHGFSYGDGYICRHPEIERIIARTEAQTASRKALRAKASSRKN
jgi:hypothetical protein